MQLCLSPPKTHFVKRDGWRFPHNDQLEGNKEQGSLTTHETSSREINDTTSRLPLTLSLLRVPGLLDTSAREQACGYTAASAKAEEAVGSCHELQAQPCTSSSTETTPRAGCALFCCPPTRWGQQSTWSFKAPCHPAASPNWSPRLQLESILHFKRLFVVKRDI